MLRAHRFPSRPPLASLALCATIISGDVQAADTPRKQIIAVFDVETSGLELGRPALERLSDYLTTKVAGLGTYQVVPPAQLRRRLRQQKRESYKACYDQSCQIEIGRELAAQKSLSTKILRLGKQCVVTLALYDLRKSATERAADATGGCGIGALVRSLESAVHELAGDTIAQGGLRGRPMGVVDKKLCPERGLRRLGDPHPEGTYVGCVDSKGLRQARAIQWYKNGQVLTEGRYHDNKQTGLWTTYHQNGAKQSEVTYRGGKRHGRFTGWDQRNNRVQVGAYDSGVKAGLWTSYYPDGAKRAEEPYVNDLIHGLVMKYHENGNRRSRCPYRKGEREGRCIYWNKSGEKRGETEYRGGHRSGASIVYNRNYRSVTTYRNDKKHGPSASYRDGKKTTEGSYRDDERHGIWVTYTDCRGQRVKAREGPYEGGKAHGVFIGYSCGIKASETVHRAGKKQGRFVAYNRDGEKIVEGSHQAGRRHGTWRYFRRGELVRVMVYDGGKIISREVLPTRR